MFLFEGGNGVGVSIQKNVRGRYERHMYRCLEHVTAGVTGDEMTGEGIGPG